MKSHTAARFDRQTFLAGASAVTLLPARTFAADLPVVNVGMVPLDIDGDVSYAQDLGYYTAAGLDVRLNMLSSGSAITNGSVALRFQVEEMGRAAFERKSLPRSYTANA